jgi:hypothetical protein
MDELVDRAYDSAERERLTREQIEEKIESGLD